MTTTARHSRRGMIGLVTSAKTPKTITVEVQRTFKHPKYGKYLRRRKRYMAHDEEGGARPGDTVEIVSTRPLSKRKRWRLVKVLSRSELADLAGAEAIDPAAEILQDITGRRSTGTSQPVEE